MGSGAITVVEGSSFCISSSGGDIFSGLTQGAFYKDTRILSGWHLAVDELPLEPLFSRVLEPYRAIFVGRARRADGRADSPLVVERERLIGAGLREDLTVSNHSALPATCIVEVQLDADFADLFDVKGGRAAPPAELIRRVDGDELLLEAVRGGRRRGIIVHGRGATANDYGLHFQVTVPARGKWSTSIIVTPLVDQDRPPEPLAATHPVSDLEAARRHREWGQSTPQLDVANDDIELMLRRSQEDLGSLRIFDPDHPGRAVVAAGAPWFMALFGRDSLLSAYMALPVDPSLARGTLQTLADLQGTSVNPDTEEEPGRILHEVRLGVTAGAVLGDRAAYYGTADATPLFVVLMSELNRWGMEKEVLHSLLPHADRALAWMRDFGDKDGDGFVEYSRAAPHGLINQGWKDSWDGINFADGQLAEPPIALCEVQGYVYSAYIGRALLAAAAGDEALVAEWGDRAAALKEEFNRRFWLADKGYYAIALDGKKRPVDACASNMGHCLWSGIVDDDKAAKVAARLMSPEMFTGWGIRTLASDMGAYNPVSYHNGSVWPHDSTLVASGLMRYGFVEEAREVATGLFDAAIRFGGRLPELFCGFDRDEYDLPVPYPTSCSPQAWAAAAPVQLMRTLLRLDPYLPAGELWLDPTVPEDIGSFRADNVLLGNSRISLTATAQHGSVEGLPPGVTLRHGTRSPLAELLLVTGQGSTGEAGTVG
ncbi:glycogen debranching N-terminal domain-containing protein [Arthrobacter sp.]|uniref:amylo-alpha-1,6-glucosidase n=1 Tax=Arthrobacter sp. TaxID=1667 RepID=UPI0033944130